MKKMMMILTCALLLMSSCGSYEATGAYTGSQFGHILGSAIGGIAGGWRGHEIGSIIGTVGGAAVGAAVGHAADKAQQQKYEDHMARRGYDPQMRGDDRITFDTGGSSVPSVRAHSLRGAGSLVIRHAGIYESERDGVLKRGETCQVVFEIANEGDSPVFDVFPLVEEATGNKHIHISPNLRIESIAPHQAIRYTATLGADRGLRNGQIEVRIGVAQGNRLIESQTRQFTLTTRRK